MSALLIIVYRRFPPFNNIVAMTGIIDRTRFRWGHKKEENGLGCSSRCRWAVWSITPIDDTGRAIHPVTQSSGIDPLGFQNTHWAPRRVWWLFEAGARFPRFPVSFTRPHFGHAGRHD